MYQLIKKILFQLDPETSHYFSLQILQLIDQLGITRLLKPIPTNPCSIMGLTFPNRVGLAAGLDKNADYVDALSALQFGFIEVGTVTPKAQEGNPKPRLFRLTKEEAIINRMGFNNKGVDYVADKLKKMRYRGILGINIGKNKDTPNENAIDDYLIGFRKLWPFASYMTINISSPNTPGLRDLQQGDLLNNLLSTLKKEQQLINKEHQKYVPLIVKISPDLTSQALDELAAILLELHIDGVIATNTTINREGVLNSAYADEAGGLSGRPLTARSTQMISKLCSILKNNIPVIASGGVMDVKTAQDKLKAGAALVQVYTGFIYQGPRIIRDLAKILCKRSRP